MKKNNQIKFSRQIATILLFICPVTCLKNSENAKLT